jgi:cell wall-associated NlpC family hydrolase
LLIFSSPQNQQQFQVGSLVTGDFAYGDLIFFSKYGSSYQVAHVGINIGGDKFAHSCASKVISIASLNKRYYRLKYVAAKRIVT